MLVPVVLLVGAAALVGGASVKKPGAEPAKYLTIQMPGRVPIKSDDYVCTSMPVDPAFVCSSMAACIGEQSGAVAAAYYPIASKERVHHMLVFGCMEPGGGGKKTWDCGASGVCSRGAQKILYAWARDAPSLQLPDGVGYPIGVDEIKHVVLQVHYANMFSGNVFDYTGVKMQLMKRSPPFLASVYLFASGGVVPPNKPTHFHNLTCPYRGRTELHPFAFRTHTHNLGRVVSACIVRRGKWIPIGKRNPLWPQMFQKIDATSAPVIEPGDRLAAQCRFNSSDREEATHIGATGHDEMCNFYMMYYRDARSADPFTTQRESCGAPAADGLFSHYPPEMSALLPRDEKLEETAHQSSIAFGVVQVATWSDVGGQTIGQVGGMAFDKTGRLHVFHRGPRVWNSRSFDTAYNLNEKTPVDVDTVLVLNVDQTTPAVVRSWGKGLFYFPHGIFVDDSDNVYLTDVGSHQVSKYCFVNGEMREEMVFGTKLVPGDDEFHFCQPAAVAVSAEDGAIFVADGYCNSRIVVFDSSGRFLTAFGQRTASTLELAASVGRRLCIGPRAAEAPVGTFLIPHDLMVDSEKRLICVADRENGRVLTLQFGGTFVSQLTLPDAFATIYSVDYDRISGNLLLLPGRPSLDATTDNSIRAFAASAVTNRVLYGWQPQSEPLRDPHVIRVDSKGQFVYIGQLSGGKVRKFEMKRELRKMSPHHSHGMPEKPAATSKPELTDARQQTAEKTSAGRLLVLSLSAAALAVVLVCLCCVCVRFRKQGGFRRANMAAFSKDSKPLLNGIFSKDGFQPLSTEDLDAADDLTTDDSDVDDTIYPLRKQTSDPLKA